MRPILQCEHALQEERDEVPEKENLKTMQLVKYYDIFFIKVLFCFLTIYFYTLKKVNVCWLFIPCTYVICLLCVSVYKSVCMYSLPMSIRIRMCACLFVCVERYLKEVWRAAGTKHFSILLFWLFWLLLIMLLFCFDFCTFFVILKWDVKTFTVLHYINILISVATYTNMFIEKD